MSPARAVVLDIAGALLGGACAGGLLVAGIVVLDLPAGRALLDVRGDGLDLRDLALTGALFSHLAVLTRFVLPAVLRL